MTHFRGVRAAARALAIVVTCATTACRGRGAERTTLADPSSPLTGYLVVRAPDCDTHVATVNELLVPSYRGRLAVGGVIVVGPAGDTSIVRRAMRAYDLDVPLYSAAARRFEPLTRLATGDGEPPSVMLVNRRDSVVLVAASPTNYGAMSELRRHLATLVIATR